MLEVYEILKTVVSLLILLFSVVFHEVAHGFVAYRLGDPTAKYQGRLSLNPLKHLDPIGSVMLPLFMFLLTRGAGPIFGYAKPVPVNPYNFKDQKWGNLKVSIAGPATNFLIAITSGLILRFFPFSGAAFDLVSLISIYNFLLGIFNLLPIPPLDGSHILFSFLPEKEYQIKSMFREYGFLLLMLVILFGLNFVYFLALIMFRFVAGKSF